jgi:PAS domain S-box-containing protein
MDYYLANSVTTFVEVAILAAVFFIFFKRGLRQTYFHLWTLGWALTLLHYMAQVVALARPSALTFAFFLDRYLLSLSVAVFFLSAREFVRLRRSWGIDIGLGVLFSLLSYQQIYWPTESPAAIVASTLSSTLGNVILCLRASGLNWLLGIVLIATGVIFLRFPQRNRHIGVPLLGAAFVYWGAGFVSVGFLSKWEYIMPLVAQLLNLPKALVAVGMIIFLLEQEKMEAHKHRDEAVRQRDFSQNLMESAYDAVCLTDQEGRITWANQAASDAFGLSLEKMKEKYFRDFVLSDELRLAEQVAASALGGKPQSLEMKLVTASGRICSFQISMSRIQESQKNAGVLVVGRDVTEIKAMERQLKQAEKMTALARMISGTAHELNNPLTSVMGFSELSLRDETLELKYRQRFEQILEAASRSKRVIENLQSFVRVPEHSVEHVELNDMVVEVLHRFDQDLEDQQINTSLHLGQECMCVRVDRDRFSQVIESVFKNAVDAIHEKGADGLIGVTTWREGDQAVVSIADNGSGIKEVNRIFEPFYSTKDVGKGTGLALSVSYSIVQHYGGKIIAENNHGGGATFYLLLPLSIPTNPDVQV